TARQEKDPAVRGVPAGRVQDERRLPGRARQARRPRGRADRGDRADGGGIRRARDVGRRRPRPLQDPESLKLAVERAPRNRTRRLHSISGVVPIGAFLVLHLWTNTAAAGGADAYNAAARRLQQLPLLVVFEILLIGLPIFFHGIYGFYIAATESPIVEGRTPARRALAVFQRATGVVAFVFVMFHLWTSRLVQLSDHGSLDLFHLMQASLANPW